MNTLPALSAMETGKPQSHTVGDLLKTTWMFENEIHLNFHKRFMFSQECCNTVKVILLYSSPFFYQSPVSTELVNMSSCNGRILCLQNSLLCSVFSQLSSGVCARNISSFIAFYVLYQQRIQGRWHIGMRPVIRDCEKVFYAWGFYAKTTYTLIHNQLQSLGIQQPMWHMLLLNDRLCWYDRHIAIVLEIIQI